LSFTMQLRASRANVRPYFRVVSSEPCAGAVRTDSGARDVVDTVGVLVCGRAGTSVLQRGALVAPPLEREL
jgi:hypothetical protein